MTALHYGWWVASRAAGIVAFGLVAASVISGLVLANRLGSQAMRTQLRELHEPLAVAGLVALALHGALLLGDPWLDVGPLSLAVPFALDYRPLWTGLGVIAAWLAAGLGLSFYARRRVGTRRWRVAHRLTPVVYALAVAHVLGAGSDSATVALRVLVVGTAVPACALLVLRLLTRPVAAPAPASAPPEATAGSRTGSASAEPVPPGWTAGSLWLGRST